MKHLAKLALLALAGGMLAQSALAQSAAGTWKTIDDETKQAKALVQISEGADGQLSGKIIKLFNKPDAVCEKCDGANKGKPVNGLTIVWGLKKDGEAWNGGEILDPKSGKVYSAKMKLVDGGNRLEVRGFLGVSLLGRTQVWERQ
ncbi:DUF2147 domain-containing protein [Pseudogulbenkiania subflava]|uniref:Uncharacterized conserved protein, DUF2147 family n=1 Tax=Pseudogulbenkiania subflava DSM 22618 TaxID=1123014 RepID=A0A1Y6B816_9NEIS|nr:DUF2147 domain-containing protein [Pseudogulbenkiania subflava]SME96167.1 Uncharacterized conserved protein, DUF2147 family [Pseudogulbenkiania subflava DSM 22618]